MMSRQDSRLLWYKWLVLGSIFCGSTLSAEVETPPHFYSYISDQPGCQADGSTDQELSINEDGQQWVIVAPARVVSTGREPRYAGLPGIPLDIQIAKPLERALQSRVVPSHSVDTGADRALRINRIKIVSVWHGVLGLGMGKAVPQIALEFRICVNGDAPDSTVTQEVARNGPRMSSLWHQPRGEELRHGFQQAADEALSFIADFALRPRD
jgi:hypothetical protein